MSANHKKHTDQAEDREYKALATVRHGKKAAKAKNSATGIISLHENTPPNITFSVIILHYNQIRYIEESLDSVLRQDYPDIELVFADDCSSQLDMDMIQTFVEKNRKPNLKNVIYQINAQNCGTVCNVNQAIKSAHGAYIMFFAADDKLHDAHVLSNFADALAALPEDQYMVSGQCEMMDDTLTTRLGAFVNVSLALNLNHATAQEQFQKLAFSCLFAMGATAVRSDMYRTFGYFDTAYKIIEDWSYFLHLTSRGSKIYFADFPALLHRDGGVSHFNQVLLPPHVIEYKNDSLLIQEREILPRLSSFPIQEQVKIMERYECERRSFAAHATGKRRPTRVSLVLQNKLFYLRKIYWWMLDHASDIRKETASRAKGLLIFWGALRITKVFAANEISIKELFLVRETWYDLLTHVVLGLLIAEVLIYLGLLLFSVLSTARKEKKKWFSHK
jgi:GT2 family glycosyltransferase